MNQDDLESVKNGRKCQQTGAILFGLIFISIGIALIKFGMWLIAIPLFCLGIWRLVVGLTYKV